MYVDAYPENGGKRHNGTIHYWGLLLGFCCCSFGSSFPCFMFEDLNTRVVLRIGSNTIIFTWSPGCLLNNAFPI